jgi:hypothetical protein
MVNRKIRQGVKMETNEVKQVTAEVVNPPVSDSPAVETHPEGKVLQQTFNAFGPVNVVWRDGKKVFEQVKKAADADWQEKAFKLKVHHHRAFIAYLELLAQRVNNKYPAPVLMKELEEVTDKKTIKDLEKWGFMEISYITFASQGKATGARTAVWMTEGGDLLAKTLVEASRLEHEQHMQKLAKSEEIPEK